MNESSEPGERFKYLAAKWRVAIERTVETASSIVGFGVQADRPVVLKIIRSPNDEWFSGSVIAAYDGRGVAKVLQHIPGAILLEQLRPGHSLVTLSVQGRDAEASELIAQVIAEMQSNATPIDGFPTVEDWGRGFERNRARCAGEIPIDLFDDAHSRHSELCRTQGPRRLLHGDLHHYNILFDKDRGWAAIDPKGVVGELAYELGAALRNPYDVPQLATETSTVGRRIDDFARLTGLAVERIAGWAFSQAVLSAVWTVEDGDDIANAAHALAVARAIRPILS